MLALFMSLMITTFFELLLVIVNLHSAVVRRHKAFLNLLLSRIATNDKRVICAFAFRSENSAAGKSELIQTFALHITLFPYFLQIYLFFRKLSDNNSHIIISLVIFSLQCFS